MREQRKKRAQEDWEYERSVMSLIGSLTVTWAGVERMLDELIAFHQQQRTDLSQEHPKILSKKLEYLKNTMQRDARLAWGTREFLRRCRIEAKRLGNERHEIIHGLFRRTYGTVVWQSQRVIYDGPNARVSLREFHNDDLVNVSREITEFSHYISPRIWLLIGNDYRNPPGGDIEEIHRELLRLYPPVVIP